MPNIGPLEITIVLVIALIVFGPKKLPSLGRSVGASLREFKGSLSGVADAVEPPATTAKDSAAPAGLPPGNAD
ncbi:MAG: twin-arginine translocase TatA/TatE family subunit [Actinomycetota bacterium]|nr:twin-arginine translocase TatA/TatE family subunit [Actinomycetota bacterium]